MKTSILRLTPNCTQNLPQLWEVSDPPKELYVEGSAEALGLLDLLPQKGLAIVGTRKPQLRSISWLKGLISDLSKTDLIIVSGLARGIDTFAHQFALDAGLPTIAIIGSGLNCLYPRENRHLKERILENNGLVISEVPPSVHARGYFFLKRNRLIAGWTQATCIIEAAHRSGALNTARWAREQNKTCFAVPSFPGDSTLAGNQTLIDRDHAIPLWGAHSLGAVWLELATGVLLGGQDVKRVIPPLVQKVIELTAELGGAHLEDLFNWAILKDWTPGEFYQNLDTCLQQNWLAQSGGLLVPVTKVRTFPVKTDGC